MDIYTEQEALLVDGIRKTINRFRERPLNYFTESDIHSSLIRDILSKNASAFLYRDKESNLEISLLHNEYPTNFRYKKEKLVNGYDDVEDYREETLINSIIGDRGNFDLAILNSNFIKDTLKEPIIVDKETDNNPVTKLTESVKHIINKDIKYTLARCVSLKEDINDNVYYARELEMNIEYAIEVKFIHPFNARNKNMLYEIIKDNKKLELTKTHTDGYTRCINLIFCSSEEKLRRDNQDSVISKIKKYVETGSVEDYNGKTYLIPNGVANIFIESFISKDKKMTAKPIVFSSGNYRIESFAKQIKNALKIY